MIKILAYIRVAVAFIVPFAMLLEESGKPGPEKRKEVVLRLKAEMDDLGLPLPEWLDKFVDPLLGLLVDAVVEVLNRTGFFEHSGIPSEA